MTASNPGTGDRLAERASRWIAARTTRRGLLAGVGKAAIVAVGGTGVAATWAQRASARVCGQSGISPLCPTYDCAGEGFVWGWCWYASPGCCATGGLKKICDCCKIGFANVHGYCPDGANVYCAAESCLEDPRVQSVPVDWTERTDAFSVALRFSQYRSSAPAVVVGYAPDALWAALAVPVAAELGLPLLYSGFGLSDELARLGATRVIGVGPVPEATEHITAATDVAVASVETSAWMLGRTGGSSVVLIGADQGNVENAPGSAALAVARRSPLVIGPDALGAVQQALGRVIDTVPGAFLGGGSAAALDLAVRALATRDGKFRLGVFALSSSGGVPAAVGGAALGVDVSSGALSQPARDWLIGNRGRLAAVDIVGLPFPMVKAVQSAVNGYDFHQLVGVGGQGLPVFPQPDEERLLGKVRVNGALPTTTTSKGKKTATASKTPQYPTPPPITTQPRPTTTLDPSSTSTTIAPTATPAPTTTLGVVAAAAGNGLSATTRRPPPGPSGTAKAK